MLGLASVAFFVGRIWRAHTASRLLPAPIGATVAPMAPSSMTELSPPSPIESGAPKATAARRVVPLLGASREGSSKVAERTITLRLQPTMGLNLSVDDAVAREVSTGETLVLDSKAHSLAFACEVCTPTKLAVAAGDKDDTLIVTVPIKPATLVVQGDIDKTYQIVEDPQVAVRAGANSVELKSMFRSITVRQIETDERTRVRLEAGKVVRVSF
jgi:hypothetical protein